MMKKYIFFHILLFAAFHTNAQLIFQKNYGGPNDDIGTTLFAENNHTFFVTANTLTYGAGGGAEDVMYFKTDAAGYMLAPKTHGTNAIRERARSIFKTTDGGYLISGDRKVTALFDDMFVHKLDANGNPQTLWHYGNFGDDECLSGMQVPSTNLYIIFGFSGEYGSAGTLGTPNMCYKLLNNDGSNNASRYLCGAGIEFGYDGVHTGTNVYVAGTTNSIGAGNYDGLVAQYSLFNFLNWYRAVGGTGIEEFLSIENTPVPGGVICAGYTTSFAATGEDIFVVKMDGTGGITWSRRIGGTGNERATSIITTSDGGYLISGYTSSAGAGGEDAFLIKLNSTGTVQWARTYGGAGNERFANVVTRPSSLGYAAIGETTSFTNGGKDIYMVATNLTGTSGCNEATWNITSIAVTPTITITGLQNHTTGHDTPTATFTSTSPAVPQTCRCTGLSPNLEIQGPTQVCKNQTGVQFYINSVKGVSSYIWSASNATFTTNPGDTSVTVSFNTNNAQLIVRTNLANCSDFAIDTIDIVVDQLTATTSGSTSICLNQSTNLSCSAINPVNGVTSYLWSNGMNTQTISVTPPLGNNVFTVTITDGLGCTATSTATVLVNPLPVATASSNTPVCIGQNIVLTSSGGNNYSWSGPLSFSSTNASPIIPNTQLTNAGTYTVIVTDANNCSATATTTVTVNPLPVPVVSSNSPVCVGQSIQLNGAGGVSLIWTGPNGYNSNQANSTIPNAQLSNAGNYSVVVTDANNCSSTAVVTVTVNPLPVPVVGSNSPVCVGQNINLNASGGITYSWAGPNAFVSGIFNPSIPNAQLINSGTYTVTVTDANTCSSNSTVTVVVNPLPIPSAINSGPVCVGQPLTLNGSGGTGYAWSGPLSFTSTNATPTIPNMQLANAGIYTVTVTDVNNCSSSTTTSVIVNPLPVPLVSSNSPICLGQTIQLNASGAGAGGLYTWVGPNGFSSNTQNPSIPNALNANAGTYTVNLSNANLCTSSTNISVVVNALPIGTVGSNTPVCTGQPINLTASGGTLYSWTGPNGFTSNNQNPIINNTSVNSSGVYTVTITNANNCTASFTTSVTVHPLPVPVTGSNSPFCAGTDLQLNAAGGVSYQWSGPSSFSSTLPNPIVTNAQPANAGLYTVTVTDANSCTSTSVVSVVIYALPVVTATNNGPLCPGNTLTLSSTSGASYSWTGPNGFSSTVQNPFILNVAQADSGIYTVIVTDVNSCTSSASTQLFVTLTLPLTAIANSPLCEGDDLQLFATNGTTFSWTGPNGYTSVLQNPVINNVTPAASGTYSLTATNVQGCSGSATVDVIVAPAPLITLGNDTTVCGINSYTLNPGNSAGNHTYVWNNGSTNQTLDVTATGTYTVTVTSNGCSTSQNIQITFETLPVVNLGQDMYICSEGSVLLNATNVNATYQWNTGSTTPTIIAVSPGTYTVTVTKCNTSVTDQIQILLDTFSVIVSGVQTPECNSQNGSITVDVTGGIGSIQYEWPQIPGNNLPTANNLTNGTYQVIVTDGLNCTAQVFYTLVCNSTDVSVPQFLSPNGDGRNDIWVIDELLERFPDNTVVIYNRWGTEVYKASPYMNDWNGKPNVSYSLGTDRLPSGTYFYILDLYGTGAKIKSGYIEIDP